MIAGDLVDQNVVEESAVAIEKSRVVCLPSLEFGRSVGGNVIHQLQRLRAAHFDLAHVAHVEYADALAHGAMFLEHARVLDGHVPSGEIDHLCSHPPVHGMERSGLERGAGLAHESSG